MKVAYSFLAAVLVLGLALSACSSAAPAAPTAAAPAGSGAPQKAAPANLPKDLVIGTNPVGSSFNTFGVAFADLISKRAGMTGKVLAVSGPAAFLPMMQNSKEVDIGVMNSIDSMLAYQATDPAYAKINDNKGFDLRALTGGPLFENAVFVRADSPIKSLTEVKGKKMHYGFGGHTFSISILRGMLANAGFTPDDIVKVDRSSIYVSWVEDFVENKIDVQMASLGSAVTVEAEAKVGLRALGFDKSDAAVKRAREVAPWTFSPVKAGAYPGVKADINSLGYPVYLISRASLSDDAAYAVVKAMSENYADYAAAHPTLKIWTPDTFVDPSFTIPYHPGAIKFYKEKGKWTAEMDASQAKRLTELKK